jgi:hypothetical protein
LLITISFRRYLVTVNDVDAGADVSKPWIDSA